MTDCLGVYQHRFAFDCTPGELLRSTSRCQYCHGIFDGIREFREDIGDFVNNVSRIYVRGPAEDGPYTLSLEIYFRESRPKLGLEFLTHNKTGEYTHKNGFNGYSHVQPRYFNSARNHSSHRANVQTQGSDVCTDFTLGSITHRELLRQSHSVSQERP